jgi:hypothetical protein
LFLITVQKKVVVFIFSYLFCSCRNSVDAFIVGQGVVIVKNGQRICGTGGALASAPIEQTKAYFETKLQSSGMFDFPCVIYTLF